MAKKSKPIGGEKEKDGERQGYVPGAPGIYEPFIVEEGGHEGAIAAYGYQYFTEGRITKGKEPRDKFVDYDSCFKVEEQGKSSSE